jgi:predicted RNA-binding protein associated with RNAse of E/G family
VEKDSFHLLRDNLMPEITRHLQGSAPKLHLRYVRLPNQVLDIYDDLIYKSEKVIVGRAQITSEHRVVFDRQVVLAPHFQIAYFDLMGKWFDIGKIRDLQGRHTGYYCDIVTPPRQLDDGCVELTDLFLDLWVSPDLRYKVLDEEELEDAFRRGWVTKALCERAKKELSKLIAMVKRGDFPPKHIKQLEEKLNL